MTHTRRRTVIARLSIAIALLVALVLPSRLTHAATTEEVGAAIDKAKKFLYSIQGPNGDWDSDPANPDWQKGAHYGGFTCIATYALLAAGESPQDERIQKAIEFLKKTDIKSIYALGLRAQVWTFLPRTKDNEKELQKYILRDAELLLKTGFDEPSGLYGYTVAKDSLHNSPSQYGVLGVWAIEQCGVDVNPKYWEIIEKTWKKNQGVDGSWQYSAAPPDPGKGTPAFTAAGVATLYITQDYLHASEGTKCTGNLENPNVTAGLKWMAKHVAGVGLNGYVLYGIERIGVASGLKYFGTTDWYAMGAETLVRGQGTDGSWDTYGKQCGTSWGMIFLVRGRAPVMMNKLAYDVAPAKGAGGASSSSRGDKDAKDAKKEGNWNERSRDCANVVRWVAKQSERDLNWQIVNLKVPVEELHDSPILYIAGNQALSFTDEEEKKLKAFIEQGGLIVANADCASAAFNGSVKKLGQKLFPAYEFVNVPAKHPINVEQRYPIAKMRTKPDLMSMSNGSRELIILMPSNDPAKQWQMRAVSEQESMFQIADNIYEYAVDKKNARFKGDTYLVARDEKVKADRTMKVARLQYDGKWDPEPGGWRRLANIMHNEQKFDLTAEPVKLGDGKLLKGDYKAAHLTGTGKFALNGDERKEIVSFVEGGGTLIIDACGGQGEFAQSADAELAAMFPAGAKDLGSPLKFDQPVFNIPNAQIRDVAYRSYARRVVGNTKAPQLRGIEMKDRIGVFYSREDLSTGMVGQAVDGIIGYEPRTATALMTNLMLYAAAGGKIVGVPPAKPVGKQPASAPAKAAAPVASSAPATAPAADAEK